MWLRLSISDLYPLELGFVPVSPILWKFWEEWGTVALCILGWPRPHCTAQVDLELVTTFLLNLLSAGITSMNHHDQHSCLFLCYIWYSIKTKVYSYFMCKGILSLCLCTICTYCLGRPEKGIRAHETGVTYELGFYRRAYTRATSTLTLCTLSLVSGAPFNN